MNERQRFLATMRYESRDRSPICDFGFWPETIEAWHRQGLPEWVQGGHNTASTSRYFGMDTFHGGAGGHIGMLPGFESKVVETRGDHEVVQQGDGVLVLRAKTMSSIPVHLAHTLVDRASWNKHYKPRFDPATPGRLPDFEAARKIWNDPDYPTPHVAWCGSLYGWIRDWMGLEAVSMAVYDDPAWFEEMVTTLADLTVHVLTRLFEEGARFDAASFWEDMCYRGGPLLSPAHFRRFLVPQYRRITELLRRHGCEIAWVDCDGCIDELIPLWLEAGVNCMFPVEVGVWGADAMAYRRRYGRELLMMGGVDKVILAKSKSAISAEVARLAPLVEEGGFIAFCDHRVPPDVSLENYTHYLHEARRVWGKGVNLKPFPGSQA